MKQCSAIDCERPPCARGLCQKHYKRWQAHGDPNYGKGAHSHADRFRSLTKLVGECIEWQGAVEPGAYGRSGGIAAHRVAYETAHGAIPPGMQVLHSCDNRRCVNPAHLSVGSSNDNVQDCVKKKRHNRGEAVNTAILSEDDIRQIRRMHRGGYGENTRIAKLFNVSPRTICDIVARSSWRHVA